MDRKQEERHHSKANRCDRGGQAQNNALHSLYKDDRSNRLLWCAPNLTNHRSYYLILLPCGRKQLAYMYRNLACFPTIAVNRVRG
jgi:hypothetical protein